MAPKDTAAARAPWSSCLRLRRAALSRVSKLIPATASRRRRILAESFAPDVTGHASGPHGFPCYGETVTRMKVAGIDVLPSALVLRVRQLHELAVELVHLSALLRRLEGVHGRAVEPPEQIDELGGAARRTR